VNDPSFLPTARTADSAVVNDTFFVFRRVGNWLSRGGIVAIFLGSRKTADARQECFGGMISATGTVETFAKSATQPRSMISRQPAEKPSFGGRNTEGTVWRPVTTVNGVVREMRVSAVAPRFRLSRVAQAVRIFGLETSGAQILALNRFIDLAAMHGDFRGGRNAQADFVTANIDDRHNDRIADDDALVAVPR